MPTTLSEVVFSSHGQLPIPVNTSDANLPFTRLFERQVARTPNAIAVEFEGETVTYAELNSHANRLARRLLKDGYQTEERIGICMDRSIGAIVSMFGILKAGLAFVPLDPEFPKERLEYIVDHADIRTILCDEKYRQLYPYAEAKGLSLIGPDQFVRYRESEPVDGNDVGAIADSNLQSAPCPNDLAYVMYTSGSTGKPKGVQIEHKSLTTYCLADIEIYRLQTEDRTLQFSTLNFDVAIEEIFPPLLVGSTVVVRPRQRADASIELSHLINTHKVTAIHIATAYWNEWIGLMEAEKVRVPRSLRLVIVTGEKISVEHYRRWRNLCDHEILWCNAYGPTETTVTCTAFIPDSKWDEPQMPIGKPLPGYTAHILNEQMQPVGDRETGHLFIGGPAVARGYLARPDLTEKAFLDVSLPGYDQPVRIYRTGDLARWLPDGNIEFSGRVDHQMKIGSYRIEPGEIESVMLQHVGLRDALVVCDELESQKYLLAYLVLNEDRYSTQDISAFLRDRLPAYMVPTRYVILDELPKTINGKIDRDRLPKLSDLPVQRDEPSDETDQLSPLEQELINLWKQVLQVPKVGIRDDFFMLGGSSLIVTRVLALLRKKHEIVLPVRDFFANPTIESLARHLESLQAGEPKSISNTAAQVAEVRNRYPTIRPFAIESRGVVLRGIHYPPVDASSVTPRNHKVLIAQPYGPEYARSFRNLQQLAISLSQQGFDVFRFDYAGTGSSDGDSETISIPQWLHDLQSVLEAMRNQGDDDALISCIGVRLGATLLSQLGLKGICQFIAWDPVIAGDDYMRLMDSFHRLETSSLTKFLRRVPSSSTERMGYAFPISFQHSMRALAFRADRFVGKLLTVLTSKGQSISAPGDVSTISIDDEIFWSEYKYLGRAFASPLAFRKILECLLESKR